MDSAIPASIEGDPSPSPALIEHLRQAQMQAAGKEFYKAYLQLCIDHGFTVAMEPQFRRSADNGTYSVVLAVSTVPLDEQGIQATQQTLKLQD